MREGWSVKQIEAVADTRLGKTLPQGSGRVDGGQRYLRNVNVRWGRVTTDDLNTMDFSEREQSELELRAGDVLVCEGGEVGRCALITEDMPGVHFQNAIHRLRSNGAVVPAFLAYAIENLVSSGGLDGVTSQVTIAHLNQTKLRALELLIPPLAEQQRIVDLIGSLDEAIEAADDATSAISHLLLAAREAIPAGEEVQLGKLLEGIDSGVSVVTPNELANEFEPQVLKLSAVKPGFFVPEEAKALSGAFLPERARLREGDLLMTRANTPDRVGYVCVARGVRPESYMPDLVWRLLADTTIVSADFLEQVLSSTEIRRRVTATATGTSSSMKKISKAKIATVLIPLLTADEQAAYVRLTQAIESERSACGDYAASLRHLRTNLLTALLSSAHEIPVSYDDLLSEAE